MDEYAAACFGGIMNPDPAKREHHHKACNYFDATLGGAFAARPVNRGEHSDNLEAMNAYWK